MDDDEARRILDMLTEQVRAAGATVPLSDPPPLLRQRLRRLMSKGAVPGAAAAERAALVADSRRDAHLAGVRAPVELTQDRFQLTYRSAEIDVILDVARQPGDECILRGQVLVPLSQLPVFEATVYWPQGRLRTILGDEVGGFELRGVPETADLLIVTNDEVILELPLALASQTGAQS